MGVPKDDGEDNGLALEREYRNTWLCTGCGGRHPLKYSACPFEDEDMPSELQEEAELLTVWDSSRPH